VFVVDGQHKELEKREHTFVRLQRLRAVEARRRAGDGAASTALREAPSERGGPTATKRKVLGYSFWVATGPTVKRRGAGKARATMKEQVRFITKRNGGRDSSQGHSARVGETNGSSSEFRARS
jgi:hypothetical protein